MSEKSKIVADTEAYLAKIRNTVKASRSLVESAKLRIVETDRMLESAGTTREEVMKFSFSASQKEAVNEELERMGFDRLDDDDGDVRRDSQKMRMQGLHRTRNEHFLRQVIKTEGGCARLREGESSYIELL